MPATEVLVDGLDHPEGVAWDPGAGVLWAGGEDGQLYRVDVDARTFVEAARAPGFVLGLAVDGRSRVAVTAVAEDPQGTMLAAPTNVVFVGERLDRLVSANLGRWHLTLI